MTKTIGALYNILEPLFRIQESAWFHPDGKWQPSRQASATYNFISTKWPPLTFEAIKNQFKLPELDIDFAHRFLYLPPMKNDANFVPVLSLCCKLNDTQSIAKFRVMLVCLNSCSGANEEVYGIGFRMETPHSQDPNTDTSTNEEGDTPPHRGTHDFHHAQLIRTFRRNTNHDGLLVDCPIWLPQSQPSFPLPAKCPVMLLLCLMLALYGKEEYYNFCQRVDFIDSYLKKLDCWINEK